MYTLITYNINRFDVLAFASPWRRLSCNLFYHCALKADTFVDILTLAFNMYTTYSDNNVSVDVYNIVY